MDENINAQMLNAIGEAVIATDLQGNIQYWNRAAEELYQWRAEEVRGKNVVDVTPSSTTQEQAKEIMQALSQGQTWSGEFEVQRKDGSSFLAYVSDAPIHNDKGELVGIIGVSRDISEHRQIENALKLSEKYFRSIYEQSPIAIQLYDEKGKLTGANEKTLQTYGLKDTQPILGYNFWTSPKFTPEAQDRVRRGESIMLETSLDFAMVKETNLFPTDKTGILDFELHIGPLYREEDVVGYLVQMLDVTERNRVKKELEDHLQNLEALVEERTKEIQAKVKEHQTLFDLMVGREVRMAELKKVIKKLRAQLEDAGMKPIANDPLLEELQDKD